MKENWRTIVSIVFAAILFVVIGPGSFLGMFQGSMIGGWAGAATIGGLSGAFNAAINGGNLGDVLRGALVGAIQGAISGSILHGLADGVGFDNAGLHIVGHGVVGGAANEALGGKFQDGFLSAAAGAASTYAKFGNNNIYTRTLKASVVGGTASALGGGKFANGAWTAAFQHLLNNEFGKWSETHYTDKDGDFRIDSNVYGNNKDGVRSGKIQIHVGRNHEEFVFDEKTGSFLNKNGQKLPKNIRIKITNSLEAQRKLGKAFERLKLAGVILKKSSGPLAIVGIAIWSANATDEVAAYRAAIERGAPNLITETRTNLIMNSPMIDSQRTIMDDALAELDGGG